MGNGNCTDGFLFKGVPKQMEVVTLVLLGSVMVLSISCNIYFCMLRCRSGRVKSQSRTRERVSSRHMEENPIYGNVNYMQTSESQDAPHSSIGSSPLRDQQRVTSDSQSKNQDCYANLTLKAPRLQSGHSSPQIQYSDVVHIEEPVESEKEDEGNTDAVSTMSDLYASVQTQRAKTVNTADGSEGYANHL
ncbi:signaling threshold-regulating transmembrane adapter 1-like [Parambassis ranga]|uniref:Signaling threshold-regulating transmembrane adapter 1-like n=1 Tax=Parambassis ranga TaxID=210632 RepID=A0A6P7I8I3_9TELE|nr:signaling threshold-regulating transmembrane adapter 1 [Parambassis ranga]